MLTPTVMNLRIFPDASGAPAVVSSGEYRFAFDFLGEVTMRRIDGPEAHSRGLIKAIALATKAYNTALARQLGDDRAKWMQANLELYQETR